MFFLPSHVIFFPCAPVAERHCLDSTCQPSATLPRICTPATGDEHRVPSLSGVERRERAIPSVVSPRPQRERGTSEQPNKKKSNRRRPFGNMDQDEETMEVSKKSVIAKIFKVRKRREMLFVQVCFICSVLFMAWCMSALLTKAGECRGGEDGREGGCTARNS